jgi:hypothetical protein
MRLKLIILTLLIGAASVPLFLGKTPSVETPKKEETKQRAAQYTPHMGERGAWQSVAAGHDPEIDHIFAKMRQAPDESSFITEQRNTYFELLEQVRTRPEIIAKLEGMLATEHGSKPMAQTAAGALAGAGTPESQSALVRILDKRKDDRYFLDMLVPTMGFAKKPTAELEGALKRLASDGQSTEIRDLAHLAIGVSANRMAKDEPARAKRIVDDYDGKLKAARPEELSTYLSVLGNAGTADAGQVVARYVHDEHSEVRAQAVAALRRVKTDEARALLEESLDDPDEFVRERAKWALSYRAN